jgi:hypothetical protein
VVDSVLVAAPTYRGKRYCLVEYLEAYDAFQYPNRDLLLIDNTGDEGKYARWMRREFGVGVQHIEPEAQFEDTFLACWDAISAYADEHQYGWVLSLEQDVIAPPMLLDTLLNAATYLVAPFVTHTYPFHDGREGFYQGMGCTLMSSGLLKRAMAYVHEPNAITGLVEGAVYEVARRGSNIALHGLLDVRHADGDGTEFRQYKPITDPRIVLI